MRTKHLLVEGWRLVGHSYALVAQAHCLSLLKRSDVTLRFRDLAYRSSAWRRTRGLLPPDEEALLESIPGPEASFVPDVTLHMLPDFTPVPHGRKVSFGTPEFRVIPTEWRATSNEPDGVPEGVEVMTPSNWSAIAYRRFGVTDSCVHVVPHGIDPAVYRPDAASRESTRARLGIGSDDVVYLNVGAMTDNKGIAVLIDAFAEVVSACPAVRLVLKGSDALYGSGDLIRRKVDALESSARQRVTDRIVYLGATMSNRDLAALFRAADCYVSPYLAEGFNLPVLEAAACGVPVICTDGGATDDFTDGSFAMRIASRPVHVQLPDGQLGDALMPDRNDLFTLMLAAVRDPEALRRMGVAAAAQAAAHFTWDAVTGTLLDKLFEARG